MVFVISESSDTLLQALCVCPEQGLKGDRKLLSCVLENEVAGLKDETKISFDPIDNDDDEQGTDKEARKRPLQYFRLKSCVHNPPLSSLKRIGNALILILCVETICRDRVDRATIIMLHSTKIIMWTTVCILGHRSPLI